MNKPARGHNRHHLDDSFARKPSATSGRGFVPQRTCSGIHFQCLLDFCNEADAQASVVYAIVLLL